MDRCLYVGDDERDCEAAWNAGCGMVYLTDDIKNSILKNYPKPFFYTQTLTEKIDEIDKAYSVWDHTK
jgi:phosphoglycolate phosphatase-like HAD superfamily hydrolase